MEDEQAVVEKRRRWPRRLALTVSLLLALLLLVLFALWLMRVRLASDYIDGEFTRRGVQASYEIRRIGFGTQILDNLVIGDPRRPDLTAREVRVQILFGLSGPRVGLITARGVRMRGRLSHGRLSLGQVDRLLPPPSGLPFRLPDQRVDIADSAILLETPAGPLAIGLSGRGNLSDGFRGRMALAAVGLRQGECTAARPRADVAVSVDDLKPLVRGPVTLDSLRCGNDLAVSAPRFDVNALLAPAANSWRGGLAFTAMRLTARRNVLNGIQGRATFAGDSNRTLGRLALDSHHVAVDSFQAAAIRFAGNYSLSPRHGDLQLDGDVAARGLVMSASAVNELAGAFRATRGTPLGPIGAHLAEALVRAARGGGEATAAMRLTNGRGQGGLLLEQLRFAGRSGADLSLTGGDGVTIAWPSGGMRLDGTLAVSGGDFPDARFVLRQPRVGAPIEGRGRIAPISAGGARLALGEIGFTAGTDGRTRFRTMIQLDGPVEGGRVTGLTMPLAGRFGRGGFAFGEGCVNASFQSFQFEQLRLGPTRLPLCPVGPGLVWSDGGGVRAGADLRSPRLPAGSADRRSPLPPIACAPLSTGSPPPAFGPNWASRPPAPTLISQP